MTTKAKAAVYVRVSTLEQVEDMSLLTQERACTEFCAREGWEVERIIWEEGELAKTANRTQLQALLNCVLEGKRNDIQHLVVYSMSRLARNVHDYTAIAAALGSSGVELHAVTDPVDDSPLGRFVETLIACMAEFDHDMEHARKDG